MKVFGITGWKNSGKTTLVVNLVSTLRARGYSVSTLKHAHHNFDIDKEGTDSFKHREAGAGEVLIVSNNRWALMHELTDENEPEMKTLLAKMTPVDIVIVEGFKQQDHPKLQVIRPDNNPDRLPEAISNLVAIASDVALDPADYGCDGPLFDLNQVDAIADFVESHCQLVQP